jgi:hypothetical protein
MTLRGAAGGDGKVIQGKWLSLKKVRQRHDW